MSSPRVSMRFLTKIQPIWFSRLASQRNIYMNEGLYDIDNIVLQLFFSKQKLLQVIMIFWTALAFLHLMKFKQVFHFQKCILLSLV